MATPSFASTAMFTIVVQDSRRRVGERVLTHQILWSRCKYCSTPMSSEAEPRIKISIHNTPRVDDDAIRLNRDKPILIVVWIPKLVSQILYRGSELRPRAGWTCGL